VIWAVLAIALWVAVPLVSGWLGIEGLIKGVVRGRGGSYSRSESPRWFWACVTLYLGLVIWWVYLTAHVALRISLG